MTLKISSRDGERVIGAVLRAVVSVESNAAVRRGRDVISKEDATSPARRLYHACVTAHIDPESRDLYQDRLITVLAEVMEAAVSPVAKAARASFAHSIVIADHYRALADYRDLIAMERDAFSPVVSPAHGDAAIRAPA